MWMVLVEKSVDFFNCREFLRRSNDQALFKPGYTYKNHSSDIKTNLNLYSCNNQLVGGLFPGL